MKKQTFINKKQDPICMNIILSTHNPTKAEQIKAVFNRMPVSILTLGDAGILGEAIEDGETLKDNASKKARYAFEHAPPGNWVMTDDTGIFIKALNGEPGIRSARWLGEGASTEDVTSYCLKRLEGVGDRSALFETVVALISPDGKEYFFNGQVQGTIINRPRVPAQPKMPYSPLFQPEGHHKTWAEMTVEEENRISHRGKAFRQVRQYLERLV